MRRAVLIAGLCLVPLPGIAAMTCQFPTECLEGEGCIDSGYSVTIETSLVPGSLVAEDGFPTGDTIVSDAETISITWAGAGPALAALGRTRSGFHMLSLAPDGSARYSVHLPGADLSVLYLGRCEGT